MSHRVERQQHCRPNGVTVKITALANILQRWRQALFNAPTTVPAVSTNLIRWAHSSRLCLKSWSSSISIAKDSNVCSLPCHTTVLAAASPIGGYYNKSKTVIENLKYI